MRRKQQMTHAATTAAHTLRSGDAGGSGASPSLRDDSISSDILMIFKRPEVRYSATPEPCRRLHKRVL